MDQSPWKDLPNIAHINRMIEHIAVNRSVWNNSGIIHYNVSEMDEWVKPFVQARISTRSTIIDQDRRDIWRSLADHAWGILIMCPNLGLSRYKRIYGAGNLLWCFGPLVAFDDCGYLLDSNPEYVKMLAMLGDPTSVLIWPAVWAMNYPKELV
mgnify:CR=1 FL=1